MKKSLYGPNGTLQKKRSVYLKTTTIHRKNKREKIKYDLSNLWDNIKNSTICVTEITEGRQKNI